MTHWQLDQRKEAHYWYDKAVQWIQQHQPRFEEPHRFRVEAAELLGVAESQPSPEETRAEQPSMNQLPKSGEPPG
jgi:hypothetical protein